MKYRIRFKREPNNIIMKIIETIEIVTDDGIVHPVTPSRNKKGIVDYQYRPLCLQLLNQFTVADCPRTEDAQEGMPQSIYVEHAGFIQVLLSEFLLLPQSQRYLQDIFTLDADLRASRHSSRFNRALHDLIHSLPLKSDINNWVASDAWGKMLTQHKLVHNSVLNKVVVSSPQFLNAVREFYRAKAMCYHWVQEGYPYHRSVKYYDGDDMLKARLLTSEYNLIETLCSFADTYSNIRSLLNCDFSRVTEIFLERFLSLEIHKLHVSPLTDEIANLTYTLVNQETYASSINSAGIQSPELVESLITATNKLESEEYYECDSYIALCGLSLYCLIKHNQPIARCSACGRYYVPKQDRKSKIKYCYYKSPRNTNYSCSEYHSQFEGAYNKGSDKYTAIAKRIGSARTTVAEIDKDALLNESFDERRFYRFVDFARGGLSIIDKCAREADKQNKDLDQFKEDIDLIMNFLRYFKAKRISEATKRERMKKADAIFEIVDMCFDNGSFSANYDTWRKTMNQIMGLY